MKNHTEERKIFRLEKDSGLKKPTERKNSELISLNEELERFKFIVENSKEEVFLVDCRGNVEYVNQAAADGLGYTIEELLKLSVSDFDKKYGPDFKSHFEDLKRGASSPFETVHIKKDGKKVYKEMKSSYVSAGGKEFVCGFGYDITERKKTEEKIRKINKQLEAKNKQLDNYLNEIKNLDTMKTGLLSNLGHELKTPLVSIKGYTELILNEKFGTLNEKQRSAMAVCAKNINTLTDLINRLVDFSKLEFGFASAKKSRINIVETAGNIADILQIYAKEKFIEIILTAEKSEMFVYADETALKQVLINLINNAVKFNREKGKVYVNLKTEYGKIKVAVKDTGIGIQPAKLTKIFDRFYQAEEGLARKYSGMGLGLAITKDILKMHGSDILVKSQLNEGSEFYFYLQPYEENSPLLLEFNKYTAVYEEESEISDFISRNLSLYGFKGKKFSEPKSIIKYAKTNKLDLIFIDFDSPRAYDVFGDLKENEKTKDIPVIAAAGNVSSLKNIVFSIADDALEKPVSLKKMIEKIKKVFKIN